MSDTDNLMRSIATNPEFNANTRAYAANIAFENGEDCLKRWQRDFTNQGAALRYDASMSASACLEDDLKMLLRMRDLLE